MSRLAYIAALSAMVVLVFAAIASAQDIFGNETDFNNFNNGSDPNRADQAQSPTTPSEQTIPSEQTTPSEQATPAQETPTVSIQADAFEPSELDVVPGTMVTFVNDDTVPHAVSLEGLLDSEEITPGYSFPVTLGGSGTVAYSDAENPDMQGTITVGGASRGGGAAPEVPTPSVPPQTGGESSQAPSEDSTQPSGEQPPFLVYDF